MWPVVSSNHVGTSPQKRDLPETSSDPGTTREDNTTRKWHRILVPTYACCQLYTRLTHFHPTSLLISAQFVPHLCGKRVHQEPPQIPDGTPRPTIPLSAPIPPETPSFLQQPKLCEPTRTGVVMTQE